MSERLEQALTPQIVDLAIRLAVVGLIAIWCFSLLRPFITLIIWAAILAIALRPVFLSLARRLGERPSMAASLITIVGLAVILGPVSLLIASFASSVESIAGVVQSGEFDIPPPPDRIVSVDWSGTELHQFWLEASEDIEETFVRFRPQINEIAGWLIGLVATAGVTLLQFMAAMIIAGVMLPRAEQLGSGLQRLAERLAPARGHSFIGLAARTVRNVARGVVGISVLQGTILGIGFLAAAIPFAGLWSVICIFLAIVQVGPGLIVLPAIIYAWIELETLTALLFTVWMVPATLIDNVLKPIVMARGLPVPMLVILLGVIGGTLHYGLIGLFVGPVVLALGYELARAWIAAGPPAADGGETSPR